MHTKFFNENLHKSADQECEHNTNYQKHDTNGQKCGTSSDIDAHTMTWTFYSLMLQDTYDLVLYIAKTAEKQT